MEKPISELFNNWITSIEHYNQYVEKSLLPIAELDKQKGNLMSYSGINLFGFEKGVFKYPEPMNSINQSYHRRYPLSEWERIGKYKGKFGLITDNFNFNNYKKCGQEFITGLQSRLMDNNDFKGMLIAFKTKIEWLKEINQKKYINEIPYITDFLEIYSEIKQDLQIKPKVTKVKVSTNKNYTQRQVAIAYFIIPNERITESNFESILKKHSQTRSKKILQKIISNNTQLTTLSGNRTVDTKHLKDLEAAKRLLSGIKNIEAVKSITSIIAAFKTTYDGKY